MRAGVADDQPFDGLVAARFCVEIADRALERVVRQGTQRLQEARVNRFTGIQYFLQTFAVVLLENRIVDAVQPARFGCGGAEAHPFIARFVAQQRVDAVFPDCPVDEMILD